MSVLGGDSWGREAQHRKRRVENLLVDSKSAIDASSQTFKKLSNGQFVCLVCPQNPILHSPLIFSTHCEGSKHRAAESKLRERELAKREESIKRIALTNSPIGVATKPPNHRNQTKSKLYDSENREKIHDNGIACGTSNTARSERRERELKFTAAGWKRDCHGKWYKDENVEFDSDEDDPNECLG